MGLAKSSQLETIKGGGAGLHDSMRLSASATARLIPGLDRTAATGRKRPQSVGPDGSPVQAAAQIQTKTVASIIPKLLKGFSPAMLGTAVADLLLVCLSLAIEQQFCGDSFGFSIITLYLCLFLASGISEDLYADEFSDHASDPAILKKVVFWTTALTALGLKHSTGRREFLLLIVWSAMNLGLLSLARWLGRKGEHRPGKNVLIVGDSRLAQAVADRLQSEAQFGRCVKQFLPEHYLHDTYGSAMLETLARRECIDEVIVATQDRGIVDAVVAEARRNQLDVSMVPDLGGSVALGIENLAGLPLLKIREVRASEWSLAFKRLTDVAISGFGLLVLLPCLTLIALVIKLDSAGPVLYRALRTGHKGRRFTCYKFRTMIPDADLAREELRARNERHGAFFKMEDDPRITRVGGWLRRYSLDELPQLWNVLRGDMSLVGPRPHPPDDVTRYRLEHFQRLDFAPGMTGLWQVTARRDPSFERSVSLDVDYIGHWSLLLDLRILCRTVTAVLGGSGM